LSDGKKYLTRILEQVVTSWTLCHTSRSFNVGIQSTQRVEGYNSLIKRSVKSSATLFELDTHIQSLLNKEQQFEWYEQSNQNPTVGLPNVIRRYFKRIDAIIKKFLTSRVLKMQHNQINESLLYRDDEEQSNDEEQSDEEQGDDEEQSNVKQGDDEKQSEKLNFSEDDYESLISNLYALITYLNHANIHELVTRGLVCRHFFSVMFNSDKAMFHIGLISDRWYNEKFSDFQKEPAITIFSEKNTVKSIYEHQQNLSHQAKYNQGFGYAKKAIGLALEIGCKDELNNMLQRWIREKENEISFRQLEINKENLPNISNPYQTRTKGAPRKHIKSALEGNQKQKSSETA
ncbi:6976_t:CDS:2, partial [Funneliformis mosseae]